MPLRYHWRRTRVKYANLCHTRSIALDFAYARVSSEEQRDGQSIDSQVRRAVEEAGVPLERVVVEVGSATKQQTPELFKLFARARKGEVTSIWAIRQDRFQRNRKTYAAMWQLIDDFDVVFKFGDQPDIDKNDPSSIFVAGVLGSAAQFETAQLSQRTKNGIQQNRLMEKHHGRPPSGYLNVNGKLCPDPDTWDIYKDVIQTYIDILVVVPPHENYVTNVLVNHGVFHLLVVGLHRPIFVVPSFITPGQNHRKLSGINTKP